MEQENATYRETLAQFQGKMYIFQGNMNTIMEYLQAQKATTSTTYANPATNVVTDATIVITTTTDTTVNTIIQPAVSHPIYHPGPSKHTASCPLGLPPNYTPQVANGSACMPY